MSSQSSKPSTVIRRRAFTIVELLVVISIILILLSLVIVATRTARQAGDRVNSSAALRQLAVGHAAYASDHRQMLLPGYLIPALQTSLEIGVVGPNGETVSEEAAAPWTWRLAPYLGDQWEVLLADSKDASTRAAIAQQVSDDNLLELARYPSFGMNTIFVGGDSLAGGVSDFSPWNPGGNQTIAATRLSQIRNPASTILFAPSRLIGGPPDDPATDRGYYELRAPALVDDQWTIVDGIAIPAGGMTGPAGLPIARAGGETIPVVHIDASVQQAPLPGLAVDMRRWSPFADRPDWRVGD